jgi:hypothetical protein
MNPELDRQYYGFLCFLECGIEFYNTAKIKFCMDLEKQAFLLRGLYIFNGSLTLNLVNDYQYYQPAEISPILVMYNDIPANM